MLHKYTCDTCAREKSYIVCTACHKTNISVPAKDEPTICPACYVKQMQHAPIDVQQQHARACYDNLDKLKKGIAIEQLCVCELQSI